MPEPKSLLKIIILPYKPLTDKQINLLRKGIKFTPTKKTSEIEPKSGIQEF